MNNEEKLKLRELYLSANVDQRHILEEFYPELKDSEGERIRKVIYGWISTQPSQVFENGFSKEEMLAWLEQQKEKNLPNERAWLYLVADVLTWRDGIGQYLDDARVQELAKKLCSKYAQKLYNSSVSSNIENNKQESVVEPTFKVGDWVVQDNIGIYKIVEVCKSWYEVIDTQNHRYSIGFHQEYMLHLWSIKDAKDGDVLAYSDGSLTIFHYRLSGLNAGLYMSHILLLRDKIESKQTCAISNVHPATKEQCDLLFQKMQEYGY